MDFPNDPQAATIGDQYMFGPAFLVAPILDQGVTHRRVYLPAGSDWYDWYSNEKHAGGQWIDAAAPIERMPLFVRAGSIVPFGPELLTELADVQVYRAALDFRRPLVSPDLLQQLLP